MEIPALQKARIVALINEEMDSPRLPFSKRDRESLLDFAKDLMLDSLAKKAVDENPGSPISAIKQYRAKYNETYGYYPGLLEAKCAVQQHFGTIR